MPLGEVLRNKEELLSQYRVLGVSTESELRNSDNVVYVQAYTKEDGTEVKAHWRSKPDRSENNNLSINSSAQSGKSTGGASELENDLKYSDITTGEPIVDVSTPEKVQKLMYPDEIAGVKRGKPKTFEQMMQMGVNPNYMGEEDINGKYSKNCQSCNVTCELIIRGYNVEANSWDNNKAKELAKNDNSAYIDSITGKKCVPQRIDIEKEDCFEFLDKIIKKGERYEFSFHTTPEGGEYSDTKSHTVFISRLDDGKLIIYDGQNGAIAYGINQVKMYVDSEINVYNTVFYPRILRVDDKIPNPYYVNSVVRARRKSW